MRVSEFDFELPAERIAQQPTDRRDRSRLMVLERASGARDHRRFSDLVDLLRPQDLLVVNDTSVYPARLLGRKPSGGRVELLLLERLEGSGRTAIWSCLLDASRKPAPGSRLEFEGGLRAEVLDREAAVWRVRLESEEPDLAAVLEREGRMPLPPYIRRESGELESLDRERYQTVYAAEAGAIAAPTAGLHFTNELLDALSARGVEQVRLTLHVGRGTFLPVRATSVEEHRMHAESFRLPQAVADAIVATRARGGRVIAVGTTVVRTLESRAIGGGNVAPGTGSCELFIYPGFEFRVVDALITNFHLPRSTLLMLVSAFAGRDQTLAAYREAIDSGYRFYSYGDAMLIV